ncbi:phosphotransferase [Streptomyces sp. MS1.AVA.1]|uniref:Phosphotransferase n=1 Tax=Streptomyces machairae TaxID=3134109 RepID=A0ABU8UKT7_9ACTN
MDAAGGPPSYRGGPVGADDADVRAAIRDLGAAGALDATAATAAWEDVLRLPQWDADPVWLHGDLLPGNLLTSSGRLTSVIDFGCFGVGDPAADTMAAWTVFDAGSREVFRAAADVDEATWARGRGWALRFGLTAEHYYGEVCGNGTNPVLAAVGRRAVSEVLAEWASGTRPAEPADAESPVHTPTPHPTHSLPPTHPAPGDDLLKQAHPALSPARSTPIHPTSGVFSGSARGAVALCSEGQGSAEAAALGGAAGHESVRSEELRCDVPPVC